MRHQSPVPATPAPLQPHRSLGRSSRRWPRLRAPPPRKASAWSTRASRTVWAAHSTTSGVGPRRTVNTGPYWSFSCSDRTVTSNPSCPGPVQSVSAGSGQGVVSFGLGLCRCPPSVCLHLTVSFGSWAALGTSVSVSDSQCPVLHVSTEPRVLCSIPAQLLPGPLPWWPPLLASPISRWSL